MQRQSHRPFFCILALICCGAAVGRAADGPPPTGLVCELLLHPEVALITHAPPHFGWVVNSNLPNTTQSAYQIVVASSVASLADGHGDLWDSGKVASPQSLDVKYQGKPLESDHSYWWAVRTWIGNDASGYSVPQRFNTGNLAPHKTTTNDMRQVQIDGQPLWMWEDREPVVFTEIEPVRIVKKGADRYFIDFGRDAFGNLRITLPPAAAIEGRKLTIRLGEKLSAADTIDSKPPGSVNYSEISVDLHAGQTIYQLSIPSKPAHLKPPAVMMPANLGEVTPFRYCEIEGSPVPLDKSMLRQLAAYTLFDDAAASFHCSDETLNGVWDLCKYTAKGTSFLGVYFDGERERIPYEADAYISQLGHYSMDREYALARHTIEYLLVHPTWPTEWSYHVIMAVDADYQYTGNTDLITRHYDALKQKLLLDRAGADGLLHAGAIVDWPAAERDGFGDGKADPKDRRQSGPEVNTVANAFFAHGLRLMSRMADAIDKKQDAADFRSRAELVTRAMNAKLFDPARGIYIDGEGTTHAAMHANLFPLAFGLVPEDRKAKVAQFVKSRGMAGSVYAAQYLLEALYEAGEADAALDLMISHSDRSWQHMIDLGSTMTLEAWDLKYKKNLTWNHAWGAAPGNIVARELLGIRPLEPGYGRILVKPQPGKLTSAIADVPTLRGTIHAEITNKSGEPFRLEITLPANTTARIVLPARRVKQSRITLDGEPINATVDGLTLIADPVGSGRHVLMSE